ncbi:MAG TPA: FAD-dependent oxidoreductase [Verrucomicrobiae bacterium]|nr:FAD-dependent oxidoreductase [Verrucomicrobiae bacterium]
MAKNAENEISEFDVAIIGGGSAGYAAARAAVAHTDSVAIIEGGTQIGGLCILRGCMPTKALLESSHRLHDINRAREFGIAAPKARPLPATILRRKDRLVADFAGYRRGQLEHGDFAFIRGRARFVGPCELEIDPIPGAPSRHKGTLPLAPRRLRFHRCVIATGSEVAWPDVPGLREANCLTSDEAIALDRIPRSLIVLGGGSVACELAQHFARLGSRVTQIQRSGHVLSDMDPDLATVIEDQFRADGIRLFAGTRLIRVERLGRVRRAIFDHQGKTRTATADAILCALGRRPAIDSLGLDAAGVQTDHHAIVVDDSMRTSNPAIFAVGDCNGLIEVVHIAIQQGEIAGANAATGASAAWDRRLKSHVVFTEPQVATCGSSERELVAAARPFLAASYPFADHGKSMIHGSTRGFVKILCEPSTGEILGGAIVGPQAGELIHEVIAAMHWHGTVAQFAAMPHYHPTLAEILTYPAEELAGKIAAPQT